MRTSGTGGSATPAAAGAGDAAPLEPPRAGPREGVLLLALLAYAVALWVWGAGRADVHGSMEGSRALVAQQMMRTGDYLIPRRGETLYLAKPPLFYWGVVLASRLGGEVTASSVRLVCALSAIGTALLVYAGARRALGTPTALAAGAVFVTTPLALNAATDGNVDMLLALGVALALFGAFFLLERGRHVLLHAVACGAGLAIGLMTKGPIVLLFFVPTLLLYAGFRRGGPLARSGRFWAPYLAAVAIGIWLVPALTPVAGRVAALVYLVPVGMLLAFATRGGSYRGGGRAWLVVAATTLALVLPWIALAAERLGVHSLAQVLDKELWRERIEAVGSSNRGPPWTYAVEFPTATLPWCLLLPLAFLPSLAGGREGTARRMLLFARCWLLGSFVLFTVVGESRRLRYLFPALAPAALLAGHVVATAVAGGLGERARRWVTLVERGGTCVLCAAPVVLVVLWRRAGLGFSGWAVAIPATAAAGAVLGVALLRAGRSHAALLAATAVVFLAGKMHLHFGLSQVVNEQRSPRPACEALTARVPPGETLWTTAVASPSAAFYLDGLPLESLLADARRLASRDRLFVATSAAERAAFEPPSGFRTTEEQEVPSPGGALVLLRLDRAPGTPPR